MQQQTQRIDDDVALLAVDPLACIEPMGIDAGPLFLRFSPFDYQRCWQWGCSAESRRETLGWMAEGGKGRPSQTALSPSYPSFCL